MPGPLGPLEAATEGRAGTTGPLPAFALSARHLTTAAGLAALLAATALHAPVVGGRSAAPATGRAAASPSRATSLPLAAQLAASGALGGSDRSYEIRTGGREALARNPSQRLEVRFSPSATTFRAGSAWLSLSLRAASASRAQLAFGPAAPSARANRVRYVRAGLDEWYLNGPLGVEQGFTVPRAFSPAPGPLTLRIALATNARATLDAGGDAVTFTRGGAALRYGWLSATDARGRVLPIRLSLAARAVLVTVDTRGARYPLRIDPLVRQAGKLTGAPEEQGSAALGTSVALSADGNTALVGAPHDGSFAGAAWVFTRSGSAWTQQGPKLTGAQQAGSQSEEQCEVESGEEGECAFGASVALSADGNTALIGSPRETGPCPTRSEPSRECRGQGAAWVFTRSGSSWTRQTPPLTGGEEETSFGHFGRSVALSADGSTALIGAPAVRAHRGAAWVFTRSEGGWEQRRPALTASEEQGEGYFGASVALSADGGRALVGVPGDNGYAGSAWTFARTGQVWAGQAKLRGEGEVGEAHFGRSVALSGAGDVALVGGFADNGRLGAAWPFAYTEAGWTSQEKLTGTGEVGPGQFGYSVALSADGHSALIGAPGDSGRKGAAWYIRSTGASWTHEGPKLKGTEARANPAFGWSVALSADGATAMVGGPNQTEPCPTQSEPARECHGAGAVWPFVWSSEPEVIEEENTNALGPRVNGVIPNAGPVTGGTVVTITGSHLSAATGVAFGASSAAFTVNPNNSITAVSPPHQAETVDVTVTRGSARSEANLHDRFTYATGAITTGDPTAAAAAGAGGAETGRGGVLVLGASGNCALKLASRKVAVHRGARAALKLLARGSGTCRANARLSVRSRDARGRLRTRTIASRTFQLPTGRTAQVVLTLNSVGRKLLHNGRGRLVARLALAKVVSGAPARASVASVRLTLVQTRPRRR